MLVTVRRNGWLAVELQVAFLHASKSDAVEQDACNECNGHDAEDTSFHSKRPLVHMSINNRYDQSQRI